MKVCIVKNKQGDILAVYTSNTPPDKIREIWHTEVYINYYDVESL